MGDPIMAEDGETRRVTRSTVIRAAGHTAWAAPAIVVLSQAPALAVSGAATVTTAVVASRPSAVGALLDVNITFTNATSGSTGLTMLSVTLQSPATGAIADAPSDVSNNWSYQTSSGTDTARVYQFAKAAPGITGSASGTTTDTLTFRTSAGQTGTIATHAVPTTGTIADGTGAYT